jgi:ABC-type Fe3+ transport system substrate-binding protein
MRAWGIAAAAAALVALTPFTDLAARQGRLFPAAEVPGSKTLTIYSATDLPVFEPVIRAFQEAAPDVAVHYVEFETNPLHETISTACLEGRMPADLVISSAIDLQVKLVNDGCAARYAAPWLEQVPDWARWRAELFGLTYEPAVIAYARPAFDPAEVPRTRFDLIDLLRGQGERFRGRVGTYDIEVSGVGYILATADSQQAGTFGRLVESLGRANVRTYCCSARMLDDLESQELLVAYNVLGSYAIDRVAAGADIGIVLPQDYTLVVSRAAFIPRGAGNGDVARRFLDFAYSPDGRRTLTQAHLFNVIDGFDHLRRAPEIALEAQPPIRPVALDPTLLVGLDRQKRQLMLEYWDKAVDVHGVLP